MQWSATVLALAAAAGLVAATGSEVCVGDGACLALGERVSGGAAGAVVADTLAAGLGLLQFAAGGQRVAERSLATPVPEQLSYRGVRMLYVELPMSDSLRQASEMHPMFGMPKSAANGGFALSSEGPASLTIAHYPDAPITWEGEPGKSPMASLPHHLLRVQLPLTMGDRSFLQTSYALIDDDRAMLILRLGSGIPAKIANISFPAAGAALDGSQSIHIDRRGISLVEVSNLRDVGEADASEAQELFQHIDRTWGTPAYNYGEGFGSTNTTFFSSSTKATIRTARKLDLSLSLKQEKFDPIGLLFENTRPLRAFWLEGDLEVRTKLEIIADDPVSSKDAPKHALSPAKAPSSEGSASLQPKMIALRVGGAVTTPPQLTLDMRSKSCADADVIWARMKINKTKVAQYLPPRFVLHRDDGILMHQRCQPGSFKFLGPSMLLPLEYNELWVEVFASIDGSPVTLPLVLLVNDDVAVIAGHDYGGTPKKLANLTFTMTPDGGRGSEIFINVDRHGRQVMKLTARMGPPSSERMVGVNDLTKESVDYAFIMSQQFPRDGESDRPFMYFPASMTTTEGERSITDLAIELGNSPQEPLGDWFVGQPLEGGYVRQGRDWRPNLNPDNLQRLPAAPWVDWWARTFQVHFM